MAGSAVIGSLRVNLGIDSAAFSDGLKGAQSKLKGFGAALKSAIVPLAAVATGAAVAVGAAVVKTVNAADEMAKAAQKFGLPIEELSRLNYAAGLSDTLELEAALEALSSWQLTLMSLFMKALRLRAGPTSAGVLDRMLVVQEELKRSVPQLSLRHEVALARRGVLEASHLKVFGDMGIAPEWVLTGDIDALAASILADRGRR